MSVSVGVNYRPYLRYKHTSSSHPRQEHIAWDGTVLPADDPWWDTHYPQNGWRCKCVVFAEDMAGLERRGFEVSDKAPPLEFEKKINKKNRRDSKGTKGYRCRLFAKYRQV